MASVALMAAAAVATPLVLKQSNRISLTKESVKELSAEQQAAALFRASQNLRMTPATPALPTRADENDFVEGELEATFTNGNNGNRIIFSSAYMATFGLDSVVITQDKKAGEQIYTLVETQSGLEDLSARFTGLVNDEEFDYAYNVVANGVYLAIPYISYKSKNMIVDLNKEYNSIEGIAIEGLKVRQVEGGIEVLLPEAMEIALYGVNGVKAAAVAGAKGDNFLPCEGGVYVLRIGEYSVKVLVK